MLLRDFETLSSLLKTEAGLILTREKAYLLEARLLPVANKHKFATLDQLVEALRAHRNPAHIRDVAEAMTINESFFFRDGKPFDLFRDKLLPRLQATRAESRRLRIWSAACSSGQEAYSLAMLLDQCGAYASGWTIDIIGTDLSADMVDRAKQGLYTAFEVQRGLPAALLIKNFTQAGDKWQIADALRRKVRFTQHNLLHDPSALGMFDVVFCRNVLIYFDLPTKTRVLAAIRRQMVADSYLFLGGAETVLGITEMFTTTAGLPGVYTLSDAVGARARVS
jgi:chemotaxis protein methyltransferase CheR